MDELGDGFEHVEASRRTFLKRLVAASAFTVPVVTSFSMSSMSMNAAGAQSSNVSL
jgi:hypothetical protein